MMSAFFACFARHGCDIFEFIHIPRFFAAFKLFKGSHIENRLSSPEFPEAGSPVCSSNVGIRQAGKICLSCLTSVKITVFTR